MSLVVLMVVLIFVIVNKKSSKRDKSDFNATNNVKNSDKSLGVIETKEHPQAGSQDEVDLKTVHDEIYYVEYNIIPHLVELFKDQPEKASQIIITIYENLVTLQNHLRKVNPYAFGNISCEICGDIENECLAVYVFPKPFDMPLAKYGAVYFNKSQQKYHYLTLEFSLKGKFVLGAKTTEGHTNYGQRADLSKEEFIREVCGIMSLDECILQQRDMISRKYVLELDDKSFNDAIANFPLLAVCFYDFNDPSQRMLPILDQLAQEYKDQIMVGLYDVYSLENETVRAEYNIMNMPTFLFLKQGKEVKRHIGVCRKEDVRTLFEELLSAQRTISIDAK